MIEAWRVLSKRFGDVKFCEIQANLCIEGYPEKNTPTILVYKGGDIKRQVVTLRELNGVRTSTADLEKLLVDLGAVQIGDSRLQRKPEEEDLATYSSIRNSTAIRLHADDEDSDWD